MFGQISLLADEAVFFPTVQLLDFSEVTTVPGQDEARMKPTADSAITMLRMPKQMIATTELAGRENTKLRQ